jgi:hypothetical protein
MTLPRLIAMNKHWAVFPPVHISLKHLTGAYLEPATGTTTGKKEKPKTFEDFISAFTAQGGAGTIKGV